MPPPSPKAQKPRFSVWMISPIAVAFNSRNQMIIANDGKYLSHYAETSLRQVRQLWLYNDPLERGPDGAYVQAHLDEWKAQGKRVAMYCTGGIRCEKTSAWMADLGMPVYQLEGGILNYFREMPDAERDWQGECFVFDNRVALDTRLQETDTTLDDVYTGEPDDQWRLERARRLGADD